MIVYKLVRKRKDQTLGPLFINRKLRIPFGIWLDAEDHPTKGYAHRPGWHCTMRPEAPHLSKKDRVWCRVDVLNYKFFERPEAQGGKWVLAQKIKFLDTLT